MKPLFTHSENGLTIIGTAEPDQMKVFVDAACDPVRHVEYGELVKALARFVPAELLHTDVLNDIAVQLSKGEAVKERRIAKGKPPEPGHDGKIVYLARRVMTKGGKIHVKEHGTALDVENIDEKRPLVRIYKPKPGVPGKTASGKEIPAVSGKAIEIKIGPGIAVDKPDEHFDLLVATRGGYFSDDAGQLSVLEEMVFEGDFDHRFGSVNFHGSVKVNGDVKTDSYISGDKGVTITGGVHNNIVLRSSQGPIEVKGAINGGKSTKIVAGGDFDCTVIEQADIEAHGTVRIGKLAHGCDIRTQGYCIGLNAHVFGGLLYTSEGAFFNKIGNAAGVQTTVFLCASVETQKDFQDLLGKIESHDKALHLLGLHLGPMLQNPERVVRLLSPHRQKIEGLLKKHAEVSKSRLVLVSKKDELLGGASKKDEIALSVQTLLSAGTRVTDGTLTWTSLDERKGPCAVILKKDAEEFVVGDFIAPPDDKKEKPNDSKKRS